jgi:hypothetical protein
MKGLNKCLEFFKCSGLTLRTKFDVRVYVFVTMPIKIGRVHGVRTNAFRAPTPITGGILGQVSYAESE